LFGNEAIQGLIKDNIKVNHVLRDPDEPSGVALIFVDSQGENCIAVAAGSNGKLSPTDVHAAREAIASSDIVLMQLETPLDTIAAALTIADQAGVTVILNPAPAQPLHDEILSKVSILTPNESEAELLTGLSIKSDADAQKAANVLVQKGVNNVLVTLGPRGAFVVGDGLNERLPGFAVDAIDSTAAGDVFNGALAVAVAENWPLQEAVRFANAAGALSVTKLGAQPSAPARQEIETFLAARGEVLPQLQRRSV
jgi:ribokinase